MPAFVFQFHQGGGGDGLDFRHDIGGFFLFYNTANARAVEHIEHMAAVRHVHGGGVFVAVGGDDLAAQAHEFNSHFLAEFAAT